MASYKLNLPLSRVKTIMKSSPDVDMVKEEPLVLITHLTELFVADLTKRAFSESKSDSIEYKDVANIVQADDTLDFLREILPCKITIAEYKKIIARRTGKEQVDSDSDSSSDNSQVDEKDVVIVIDD